MDFVLKELAAQGGELPKDPVQAMIARTILAVDVYPPTTLFLLVPVALLPWVIAQNLWMILMASLLAIAAYLVWDLGAETAPDVWVLLAGFLLVNCEGLLLVGNVAGIVVSLCVIAAWCFLKDRYALAGAVLLALSLLIKPHDAGFVWLYFLLTGGRLRRRALQTLAVVGVVAVCVAVWVVPFSPHWPQELQKNLAAVSARGGTSDPSLSGAAHVGGSHIISFQTVLSVFWDNPLFYNLTTYLVVGALILVWIFVALKKRFSMNGALFAIAAISAISLLPVYHRAGDAKLLLLAIPACAILWIGKGASRWVALALTSASILFTADMPIAIWGQITKHLNISTSTFAGKLTTVLLLRPTPLVLLAMGCFYLWIYMRYELEQDEGMTEGERVTENHRVSEAVG